jgi:hypothetical protein
MERHVSFFFHLKYNPNNCNGQSSWRWGGELTSRQHKYLRLTQRKMDIRYELWMLGSCASGWARNAAKELVIIENFDIICTQESDGIRVSLNQRRIIEFLRQIEYLGQVVIIHKWIRSVGERAGFGSDRMLCIGGALSSVRMPQSSGDNTTDRLCEDYVVYSISSVAITQQIF